MAARTAEDLIGYIPELRRFALQLTGNKSEADDLVQDVLARTLPRLDQYDPHGSFKAWLFTIMRNRFFDGHRRKRLFQTTSYRDDWHGRIEPPAQIDRLTVKALQAALRKLPPTSRDLLLAVALHGRSYEQLARDYQVPMGTIRSRLFRARAALMAELGWSGDDEPDGTGERAVSSPS